MVNGKVNNGKMDVPSVLLVPVAVTKDNVADTVIADGFWKAADICTADYAKACTDAGISSGGTDGSTTGTGSARQDRHPAAGDQDGALREPGPAQLQGQADGARL